MSEDKDSSVDDKVKIPKWVLLLISGLIGTGVGGTGMKAISSDGSNTSALIAASEARTDKDRAEKRTEFDHRLATIESRVTVDESVNTQQDRRISSIEDFQSGLKDQLNSLNTKMASVETSLKILLERTNPNK